MVRINGSTGSTAPLVEGERGFSLIEVLAAMFILTAGLLPLVGVFTFSVRQITASTPMLVAREKAREAIEEFKVQVIVRLFGAFQIYFPASVYVCPL